MWACDKCKAECPTHSELIIHKRVHINECEKVFSNKTGVNKHTKICVKRPIVGPSTAAEEAKQFCDVCQITVPRKTFNSHIRSNEHMKKCFSCIDENYSVYQTALQGKLVIYRIKSPNTGNDSVSMSFREFFLSVSQCVQSVLHYKLTELLLIKFRLNVEPHSTPDPSTMKTNTSKKEFKAFRVNIELSLTRKRCWNSI